MLIVAIDDVFVDIAVFIVSEKAVVWIEESLNVKDESLILFELLFNLNSFKTVVLIESADCILRVLLDNVLILLDDVVIWLCKTSVVPAKWDVLIFPHVKFVIKQLFEIVV